ncbi:GAD-like domain-containing protein [Chitinivorax sp. B]|uniref:GAD-like domain-containing protein n=1 Tax=Chitinivorax sp. B TaxID=2502235 RepID=UPI0010F59C0C|nr:GAD-like domain-containing protein [Chitinivorax sp. B]
MDEFIELFLEDFGPAFLRQWVPQSSIDRYRGKLPDQLLKYWEGYGWAGYAKGRFWLVNPQEYEPVLEAWIGEMPFMEQDAYHVIARGAFGDLYLWGERTGPSLTISPASASAFPNHTYQHQVQIGNSNTVIQHWLCACNPALMDWSDMNSQPLFDRALARLGRLDSTEMYGYVPALALGCPNTVEKLQKVSIIEHLVFLAQLEPLQVIEFPDTDLSDI